MLGPKDKRRVPGLNVACEECAYVAVETDIRCVAARLIWHAPASVSSDTHVEGKKCVNSVVDDSGRLEGVTHEQGGDRELDTSPATRV